MNFIKILRGDKTNNSQDCCQVEIKEVEDERCCSPEETTEKQCCQYTGTRDKGYMPLSFLWPDKEIKRFEYKTKKIRQCRFIHTNSA